MSKLFSIYLNEKDKDKNTLLLFKSGIFYIALDEDAFYLSSKLDLKLTNLNDKIKKCGFPIASSDKYFTKIKSLKTFKIIDSTTLKSYSSSDYQMKEKTLNLLSDISRIDYDNISILEAYKLLEKFKNNAIDILKLGEY